MDGRSRIQIKIVDIKYIKKPKLTVAYVDNFLNDSDYKKVKDEVKWAYAFKKSKYKILDRPTFRSAATVFDKNINKWVSLSTASFISLDNLYVDRQQSFILSNLTRKFYDPDFLNKLEEENTYFKYIAISNTDATNINYYEGQQEYKLHQDISLFTFLFYVNIGDVEPGALYIKDMNKKIPCINNRLIIIPGCAHHAALPSKIKSENSYRCCISNFCNINLLDKD